jgi:hypothetical protein
MATKNAKARGIVTTADALRAHALRITAMTESSPTTTFEVGRGKSTPRLVSGSRGW